MVEENDDMTNDLPVPIDRSDELTAVSTIQAVSSELDRLRAISLQLTETESRNAARAAVAETMVTMLNLLNTFKDMAEDNGDDVSNAVDIADVSIRIAQCISSLASHLSGISAPTSAFGSQNKPPPAGPIILTKNVNVSSDKTSGRDAK